ncbi:hypothetical protein ACHAQJ_000712 [Trichoderma viride]
MTPKPFRAIIVGGGPVGLTAAHIFDKLGLDFLVLEQYHDVAPEVGGAIALWSPTLRIMDQLGLWDRLAPLVNPFYDKIVFTQAGNVVGSNSIFGIAEKRSGYETSLFHRRDFLQALYESLSENSKRRVWVDKKVIALDVKQDGVCVRCSDGTEVEGSIIIGADGVHSPVRELTKELARKSPDGEAFSRNEAFQTSYRVMFGNSPRFGNVKPGTLYECHRSGNSTQLFVGADKMWFFVYEKLDKPTTERKSYAQKDVDEYAARYADHRLTKDLCFGDVYKERNNAGLTNLEQGILSQWSWNRVALVGDAAHKLTPNLGWGYNSGAHDLVAIANIIRSLQDKGNHSDDNDSLKTLFSDNESIKTLFSQYQNERMETVKKIADISTEATRLSAWHTWFKMIMDYYLIPVFNLELALAKYIMAPLVANTRILDWLREPHYRTGTVPWKYVPNDSLPEQVD